ncbi:hypothetical protein HG535_0A02910 [Zygotorulaspora mrakii]|uniref:t-SNARE coiled-coil homology domain-containing protein n=1 Tax=Zygotorulaspora mrakii TaxID=42260 RepID=A0A7H9AXP4_ZYGMR|nr:uncharacterized protein HG535_0A02910 [Zygotorulaspora mrakii]QLG70352.1 hypothetical protein HG535_0A02910 [Zygotorulaspora mrakii]
MSFFDLESQNASALREHPNGGTDSGDLSSRLIMDLARQLKLLKQENSKMGTKKDSVELRDSVETGLIPNCNSLRDKIEEQIWAAPKDVTDGSKLYNDFQMLKTELRHLERDYSDKKLKNFLRKSRSNPISPSKAVRRDPESGYVSIQVSEQTPLLLGEEKTENQPIHPKQQQQYSQVQQDAIDQDELDFTTIIQRERSQQINKIHSAVQEVNAIFHQLGSLATEQGEQVNTIDGNIGQLSSNMQKANEQLNKADEHQRQRNKCGLITLIIMVVVVLIIILAVLS